MTDRTPPQERERLVSVMYDAFYEYGDAREALDDKAATEAGNRHDAAQRALIAFDAAAVAARVRAELREIVEEEPELPGPMPDRINTALALGPQDVRERLMRRVVQETKQNILARLAALAEETTG